MGRFKEGRALFTEVLGSDQINLLIIKNKDLEYASFFALEAPFQGGNG